MYLKYRISFPLIARKHCLEEDLVEKERTYFFTCLEKAIFENCHIIFGGFGLNPVNETPGLLFLDDGMIIFHPISLLFPSFYVHTFLFCVNQ